MYSYNREHIDMDMGVQLPTPAADRLQGEFHIVRSAELVV